MASIVWPVVIQVEADSGVAAPITYVEGARPDAISARHLIIEPALGVRSGETRLGKALSGSGPDK